jgi:hypothetical protein
MTNKLPSKHSKHSAIDNILGAVGSVGSGPFNIAGANVDTITLGNVAAQPYVNFALIKAHGGTIVQCRAEDSHHWEYHIIPENTRNFDRELGKIISMHLLKG